MATPQEIPPALTDLTLANPIVAVIDRGNGLELANAGNPFDLPIGYLTYKEYHLHQQSQGFKFLRGGVNINVPDGYFYADNTLYYLQDNGSFTNTPGTISYPSFYHYTKGDCWVYPIAPIPPQPSIAPTPEFPDNDDRWYYVGADDGSTRFMNGWRNFGGVLYARLRYTKHNGIVWVRGLVKNGQVGSGKSIFILPPKYRSKRKFLLPTTANLAPATLGVEPNGSVYIIKGGNSYLTVKFEYFVGYE